MTDQPIRRAELPQRDASGRFLPGTSPNPGGRPIVSQEFRGRCRDFMDRFGWKHLTAIACDPTDRHHYQALALFAAYGYGQPRQGIELTGEHGGPFTISAMSAEERRQRIAELLRQQAIDV